MPHATFTLVPAFMSLKPLDEKAALPDEPVSVSGIEDVDVRVVEDVVFGEDTSVTTIQSWRELLTYGREVVGLTRRQRVWSNHMDRTALWYDE